MDEPTVLSYTRIWTDGDGETHFEDVVVSGPAKQSPVSPSVSAYAAPFSVDTAILRRVLVEHPADTPHTAPRRQFLVHLEGEAEVEVSDGDVRRFGPGDLLLIEDTHGKGHTTRNPSGKERVTMFLTLPMDNRE